MVICDPFKGLSDLQLGDEKGTLNHLALGFFFCCYVFLLWKNPRVLFVCFFFKGENKCLKPVFVLFVAG